MKCVILHKSANRIRVHVNVVNMTLEEADILETYLNKIDSVIKATVSDRTSNVVIEYKDEKTIIDALANFKYETCDIVPVNSSRALNKEYEERVYWHIFSRVFNKLFLPLPIRTCLTVVKSVPFIAKGVNSLLNKKIEVSVLDATTIGVSILRKDFNTASSIIFLLGFSDILEEWTHKKSISDLANAMSLHIDKVWCLASDGSEVLVPINDIQKGDKIVVRTSNTIPLDGTIIKGEINVNESSMTGESLPVLKRKGSSVFAGTVVDEGECVIEVKNVSGSGRYDSIVKMIEESEKLKSNTEAKATHLSDRLVPYSFILTGAVYLFTRNITKALAVLMVDYSCALKLSMPISVLSAIKEASFNHISVKGGKFLEIVSEANTIVFDKTGTLTYSTPKVYKVVPFSNLSDHECLRIAACLEEHFPHSIANAVIEAAKQKDLMHDRELHTKVEYIVAHGIVSKINSKRVAIGSYHFIFEDEKCIIDKKKKKEFDNLSDEYSHLYLAIDGKLVAVILIEDPIRQEAKEVIDSLHNMGIDKIVMMTGDSLRTAKAVAKKVGVDDFYAEVLPEDKAKFIKDEHLANRKVIMVGDGINDSPALSEADCGIAVSDGAAIAREIADITIGDDDLYSLLKLKELSDLLMNRIHSNYRFIMSFNSLLIVLGVLGILPSTTTAYLHNASTLLISMRSMTNLIKD